MVMNDVIDTLCMLCGAYLLYAGIVMKVQGRIIGNVVLMKNMSESAIRDKEAFIGYLYWKLVIIGLVIILAAAASLAGSYMGGPGMISTIAGAVFLAAILAYAAILSRAFKKFCR